MPTAMAGTTARRTDQPASAGRPVRYRSMSGCAYVLTGLGGRPPVSGIEDGAEPRDVRRALRADVLRDRCGSLQFLFAATGAQRVRRPNPVVVTVGFAGAGGGLLLRRRCRRATCRVIRGG